MSNTIKQLGKIKSLDIVQEDGQFGIKYTLSLDGMNTITQDTTWSPSQVKVTEHSNWAEEERNMKLAEICTKLSNIMTEAKVDCLQQLTNIPIEATIEGNRFGTIKSWRVLTEVL